MKAKFNGKEINIRKVGILTGGGDCAGHNAVMFGLLRRINQANQSLPDNEKIELLGLFEGWKSLTKDPAKVPVDQIMKPLNRADLEDSFKEAGTIIKSSRTNLFSKASVEKELPEQAMANVKKLGLDCLVVLGGDDTLGAAGKLGKQFTFPMFGAPKTMDNDVYGTERTYGFASAVEESLHFLENITTTARSHNRTFVVELMGRHAGWVALYAGIAAGAEVVILPEEVVALEELFARVRKAMKAQGYSVVVVSEGARLFDKRYPDKINKKNQELLDAVLADPKHALVKARHEMPKKKDSFGNEQLGGIGEYFYSLLQKHVPEYEYRLQVCGHAIRGGIAHMEDRVLGLRFGDAIFDFMKQGKFGVYPGLKADEVIANDLLEVKGERFIPDTNQLYKMRNAVDFY
ncbi:MAG: 6-phosphofructokinase [Candidatus Saganbacteria bacterium]|nr:6-phosphofructokinase [Candidatus Saganbacteria bacterium]